jgi:hypothetical protein
LTAKCQEMNSLAIILVLAVAASATAIPFPENEPTMSCQMCETMLTVMGNMIENSSMEELHDKLYAMCHWPIIEHYYEQCERLADTIVSVVNLTGPYFLNATDELCISWHFCPNKTANTNSASRRLTLAQPTNKLATCDLCVSAINEVKLYLQMPELANVIKDHLLPMCKNLGGAAKSCEEAINSVVPFFIQSLLDILCDPEQSCQSLHLCDGSNDVAVPIPSQPRPHLDHLLNTMSSIETRGFSAQCITCKSMVWSALKILKKDSIETSIANQFTKLVCKIMPGTLNVSCYDFLGIYAKPSLQLTLNEWSAEDICEAMEACKPSKSEQFLALTTMKKSVIECDACKLMAKVLSHELQQPGLQQDIVNLLTKACHVLPTKIGNKVRCETLVGIYTPYFLENVVALSYVPELCTVVHMC